MVAQSAPYGHLAVWLEKREYSRQFRVHLKNTDLIRGMIMAAAVETPPLIDDWVQPFRSAGRAYIALGVVIIVAGATIIAFGLVGVGGSDSLNIVKFGGGLLT